MKIVYNSLYLDHSETSRNQKYTKMFDEKHKYYMVEP